MERRLAALVSPLLVCVGLAGCGTGTASTPTTTTADPKTPIQTVRAWFVAINARNLAAGKTFFEPSEAFQMDWIPNAPTNAFSHIKCRPTKQVPDLPGTAAVYCSFQEAPGSWSGNPDTFWVVSLQKTSADKWLISSYGQG